MKATYRVSLPVFEGPLDLLLSLIEREELEITAISLVQVTDQYLARLAQVEETRPDLLADFLVIAARLILLKSRALLPRPQGIVSDGELDPGESLVEQLRLYKRFKAAADQLGIRQQQGWRTFMRLAPPPKVEARVDLSEVSVGDLLAAAQEALQVAPPAPPVDQVVSPVLITTKGQMDMIRLQLQEKPRLVFQEMLSAAASRLEVAVTLLATLELLKQHEVIVYQDGLFGRILIESYPVHVASAARADRFQTTAS